MLCLLLAENEIKSSKQQIKDLEYDIETAESDPVNQYREFFDVMSEKMGQLELYQFINGDENNDIILAGSGDDTIFGDTEEDVLLGENCNDTSDGGVADNDDTCIDNNVTNVAVECEIEFI